MYESAATPVPQSTLVTKRAIAHANETVSTRTLSSILSHSVESPASVAAMRCLSPARRMPGSVFFVEKRPDTNRPQRPPDWKEAAYSVRWGKYLLNLNKKGTCCMEIKL